LRIVNVTVFLLVSLAIPMGLVSGQTSAVRGQMVLDVGQQSWEVKYVRRPCAVYDGSTFMMWYAGTDKSAAPGIDNIGLATSTDGVSWIRHQGSPVLKVGAPGTWDSQSVNTPWVIREGNEYKMWYTGRRVGQYDFPQAIGYATSPDGVNWTKYSGNPVLTKGSAGAFDDDWVYLPVVISSVTGYTMHYTGASSSSGTQGIGIATSTDGIHWTKKGNITIPSSHWDSQGRGSRFSSIIKLGETFAASYDGLSQNPYNPSTTSTIDQIGFATSTDGTNWTPYPGNPVITYGTSNSWDDRGVFFPYILAVGSQYYVYYSGANQETQKVTIGLAMLSASQYAIPEFASVQLLLSAVILAAIFTLRPSRKSLASTIAV